MKKYMTTTKVAKMWFEDGVIKIRFTVKELEKEGTLEAIAAENKIKEKIKGDILVMTDIRSVKKASVEARRSGASPESTKGVKKQAIIFGGPISRTIANFYLGINKPPVPTKIFGSEEDAIKWLKGKGKKK